MCSNMGKLMLLSRYSESWKESSLKLSNSELKKELDRWTFCPLSAKMTELCLASICAVLRPLPAKVTAMSLSSSSNSAVVLGSSSAMAPRNFRWPDIREGDRPGIMDGSVYGCSFFFCWIWWRQEVLD